MKAHIFLSIFCFAFQIQVFGQGQGNNWCFGDSVGIHFDSLGTSLFSSGIKSVELAASISDSAGNLLLYFGGNGYGGFSQYSNLWNGNHQVVSNGTFLFGYSSCTQGGVFVPFIDSANYYFLFQLGISSGSNPIVKLYYSIINTAFNNGLGVVVLKNILILDTIMTEKMQLVKHANGRDYWLLVHTYGNNSFYKYLISKNQIYGPYIQNIGNSLNIPTSDYGQLSVSKNGNKICILGYTGILDIFDFDRCTGILSNFIGLGNPPFQLLNSFYGCSFSPNERFLYVSTFDSLVQFDLNAANVSSSQFKVFQVASNTNIIGQHLLGPDNKIYVANGNQNNLFFDSLTTHLSVIENPDLPGNSCGFNPYCFSLGGKLSYISLPNIPNYNLGPVAGSICDSLSVGISEPSKSKDSFFVFPNPAANEITIQYNLKNDNKAFLSVFDLEGRERLRKKFPNKSQELKLDMSSFQSGVYIISITCNDRKVKTEKLVVIK